MRDDDAPITLAGTKPRKLLARLLVDANSVVSVDALTDALWTPEEALPENAAATIQVYVSNLRRALGPQVIRTTTPGYALDLDGHTCDAHQLADFVAAARTLRAEGHTDGAIAAARRATDLPRGEPYADVAYEDWAQAAVRELTETVLSAHEELHAALLAADRDDEAIPQLEAFSAQHPYRERARGQLMLALYRTGRQADALRTYSEGRDAMVEALGVEPGSELQQLATRILDQDPELLPRPARGRVGPGADRRRRVDDRRTGPGAAADLLGAVTRGTGRDPGRARRRPGRHRQVGARPLGLGARDGSQPPHGNRPGARPRRRTTVLAVDATAASPRRRGLDPTRRRLTVPALRQHLRSARRRNPGATDAGRARRHAMGRPRIDRTVEVPRPRPDLRAAHRRRDVPRRPGRPSALDVGRRPLDRARGDPTHARRRSTPPTSRSSSTG